MYLESMTPMVIIGVTLITLIVSLPWYMAFPHEEYKISHLGLRRLIALLMSIVSVSALYMGRSMSDANRTILYMG